MNGQASMWTKKIVARLRDSGPEGFIKLGWEITNTLSRREQFNQNRLKLEVQPSNKGSRLFTTVYDALCCRAFPKPSPLLYIS